MDRKLQLVVSNNLPSQPKPEHNQLMSCLVAEASARNETPAQLAKHLGIGYAYLRLLLMGKKDPAKLGRNSLVAAAEYLDISVTEAYLYAGALKPTDFVHERKFKQYSGDVYDEIYRHPKCGGFLPERREWEMMSTRARLAFMLMFEKVSNETLIDKSMRGLRPDEDNHA